MVDYSKWDNLDSDDSDSDTDDPPSKAKAQADLTRTARNGSTNVESSKCGDTRRRDAEKACLLEKAEQLRLQGNAAYERGDLHAAMGAYEAQLSLMVGRKDGEAIQTVCVALLNQASALIQLKKFADAEARCTRLLESTDSHSASIRPLQARALHLRGFARLGQSQHQEAAEDLRSVLADGHRQSEEAKALLMEAEAGMAMASCDNPEARGRGDNRAAAKHFREAAARARRRCESHANSGAECAGSVGGVSNAESASLTFARNLRMEALAVARAGDASAAESLLKGGLREVTAIMSKEGGGNARVAAEGEGIMLSALGNLLAEQGKHGESVTHLRTAVSLFERALGTSEHGEGSSESTATTNIPTTGAKSMSVLREALFVALRSLASSLLSLVNKRDDGLGERGTTAIAVGSEEITRTSAHDRTASEEAIHVLNRALDILKLGESPASPPEEGKRNADDDGGGGKFGDLGAKEAVVAEGTAGVHSNSLVSSKSSSSVDAIDGKSEHAEREATRLAQVFDALSDAHAHAGYWEQARSAAEKSLAVWRSLGDRGKAGAAASLLSLGHLVLQLYGVAAGLERASARWEEAATILDACARPLDAGEVRLRVSSFYSRVVQSDPARLQSLEEKIAKHFAEAARLFARQRAEDEAARQQPAPLRATAADSIEGDLGSVLTGEGMRVGGSNPQRLSNWELAQKEALAWEGYAGAVGDDYEETASALRKSERLLGVASVSERDEGWTLRRVAVLQSLALALARGGNHAAAEDRLLAAIGELRELDDSGAAHKETLIELYKYLGIARRARGDMPGATEAMKSIAALGGGSSGQDDVEDLNRMLGHNRISVD